jgi:RNA polymerase sigma-70 factor (ECF subfamily)
VTQSGAQSVAGLAAEASRGDADDAVLARAAQANPAAFVMLYERYVDRVHRYCYLKLGSREAAEDATSQVFLEALAGIGGYRGGYFAGWLFRIAQHTVTDTYRERRPNLPIDAAGDVRDPAAPPEHHAVVESELDQLRAALAKLPDDQRAVLDLQLADLTTAEIAEILGRSPNAVRIARYRALQRLRTILLPDPEGTR